MFIIEWIVDGEVEDKAARDTYLQAMECAATWASEGIAERDDLTAEIQVKVTEVTKLAMFFVR